MSICNSRRGVFGYAQTEYQLTSKVNKNPMDMEIEIRSGVKIAEAGN